jgi:HSP20 family molecular chaperone IbpA
MEDEMPKSQALEVQQKKELASKDEKTVRARYYVPPTDIYETEEALTVVMEVPGVKKDDLSVNLENDTLRVEAQIDASAYEGLEPVYTEYNVGHFARNFALSSKIDQQNISALLDNGVLTLTLNKVKEAQPRRIAIA